MSLVIALVLFLGTPASAQSELGLGAEEFGNGIPSFDELFRARPPMGKCPLGATDDRGPVPEASHILHLGVPRFYIDYRRRLKLSSEQLETFRREREQALAEWAKHQATIDALELRIWVLTGDPDFEANQLEEVLKVLEDARSTQRVAFIEAVRSVAHALTPTQRRRLVDQSE